MIKDLAVYYHIWSPADTDIWKLMVDEQIKKLHESKIINRANLYCCINGVLAYEIKEYVSMYDWINILDISENESEYEGFTLKRLYEECKNNQNVKAVMYFHTKGISHYNLNRRFRAVNSWRHFMEWGVIEKWKEAVFKLNEYHVSGVNYSTDPWPHMSGNFWWARADYIKTLKHPTENKFDDRLDFEKWIGSNNPKCFSFYDAPAIYDHKNMKPNVQPYPGEPQWFWLYRDDIHSIYKE